MFDGTNLTLISDVDVDQDRKMFSSHERSLTYKSRYKKEIKQR